MDKLSPCPAHGPTGVNLMRACTCTGEPLFACDHCDRFTVPAKKPGLGYICDACLAESDDALANLNTAPGYTHTLTMRSLS